MMSWFEPWDISFFQAAVLSALAVLWLSCFRREPAWRNFSFWGGIALCYAVSFTSFNYYAEHSFFMGRIQHAVLQHFGSFLIALALPPVKPRSPLVRVVLNCLGNPFVAIGLFDGTLLFWLIPSVHFLAMLDARLFDLMNITLLLSGLLFWGAMFSPFCGTPMHRIAVMLAVVPAQIAAGLVLTFTPHDFYPIYTVCGRAFGGLTALQDQQIGGLILWIHGAMMSLAGILIVIYREISVPSRPPAVSIHYAP
jgi:putative membrane protein